MRPSFLLSLIVDCFFTACFFCRPLPAKWNSKFYRSGRKVKNLSRKISLILFSVLVFVLASLIVGKDYASIQGHADEDYWISGAGYSFKLISSANLLDKEWEDNLWLFHRPEVLHFLIGLSIKANKIPFKDTQIVISDLKRSDYGEEFIWNKPERRFEKSTALVKAARLPVVSLAIGSVFLLWLTMNSYLSLLPAMVAVLLLLQSEVFLQFSRQAMSDTVPLFFELLTLLLILLWIRRQKNKKWLLLLLAAIASSVSFSIRFTTLFSWFAINIFLLFNLLISRDKRIRLHLGRLVGFNGIFGLVFFLLDPTYYRRPLANMRTMLLSWQKIGKLNIAEVGQINVDGAIAYVPKNEWFIDNLHLDYFHQIFGNVLMLGVVGIAFLALNFWREVRFRQITEKSFLLFWLLGILVFHGLGFIPFAPRYYFFIEVALILLISTGIQGFRLTLKKIFELKFFRVFVRSRFRVNKI